MAKFLVRYFITAFQIWCTQVFILPALGTQLNNDDDITRKIEIAYHALFTFFITKIFHD